MVWDPIKGLIPLVRLSCGLWVAHAGGARCSSSPVHMAGLAKRVMNGELVPYHAWSSTRLFTEVVPFYALICRLERERQARGRKKSKFMHYL
jgi:hypothetical protein